jgi:hypothetical protein
MQLSLNLAMKQQLVCIQSLPLATNLQLGKKEVKQGSFFQSK